MFQTIEMPSPIFLDKGAGLLFPFIGGLADTTGTLERS
jgi:hypothetical protein